MKGLDVKREAGVNPARSRHCIRGVWDMCNYMCQQYIIAATDNYFIGKVYPV